MQTPEPKRRGRTEDEALDAILADIAALPEKPDENSDENSDDDARLDLSRPDRFDTQ